MNPAHWYREAPPRWTFLDTVNWEAIAAHEIKFMDMPKIGNPAGFLGLKPLTFGPRSTPTPTEDSRS